MDSRSRGFHSLLLSIPVCFSSSPTLSNPRATSSLGRSQGWPGAKCPMQVTQGTDPQCPRLRPSIPVMPFKWALEAAAGPRGRDALEAEQSKMQKLLQLRSLDWNQKPRQCKSVGLPSCFLATPSATATINMAQPIKSHRSSLISGVGITDHLRGKSWNVYPYFISHRKLILRVNWSSECEKHNFKFLEGNIGK